MPPIEQAEDCERAVTSRVDPEPHLHAVQFYETDAFLAEAVRDFIGPNLGAGHAAVVVATQDHHELFVKAMEDADIEVARRQGRFISADAATTLSRFMVGGRPDERLFREVVGDLVASAERAGRKVYVYGEMVALLWSAGKVSAAIRLEELWNELGKTHRFSLLCAYPMSSFGGAGSTAPFREVLATHSSVALSESYAAVTGDDESLRRVALLQQAAVSSAHERERLKEVDRIRNDFIAMIVHDIRTPLAIIAGLAGLLESHRHNLEEERVEEFLDRISANAEQISRLLTDLSTVVEIESGEFAHEIEAFDLAVLVRHVAGDQRAAFQRTRIVVDLPDSLPPALADERRQMQVLFNLLDNAVKFSPEGSTVRISVVHDGPVIKVSVGDQGPGIAVEDQPRLFEKFLRLDATRNVGGTGLGLFIAKELVEAQNGEIWVESARGQGATFTYTVPVARSQ